MTYNSGYIAGMGAEAAKQGLKPPLQPMPQHQPFSGGLVAGVGLTALLLPSAVGAVLGALVADKQNRTKYALAGAVAVPLIWLLK